MRKFFKTVAIVTVFSVCEKFLGFLYRIFLSRYIGTEGIGIYQVALSVFALFLTVCCSGTPVTVSRLMLKYQAENKPEKVKKVITAGLTLSLATAVPICILCFILKGKLNFFFADERCISVFLIIIPGLIFTSVYSILRGVFWGEKDFLPYSIIELLEEICMILVGIALIVTTSSPYEGAYRAGFAVLVSYIFSFALGTAVFFIRKHKLKNPISELKPLIASSAPITAMRTANSVVVSLVSIILPMRLIAGGMTDTEAMSAFGAAVGQAIPLLFIPTTLIGSFTLVLVPEISENFYKKKHFFLKRDIEKSLKFAVAVTCLFIPVFTVLGKEIGIIIFDSHECGKYLTASAYLMFFMTVSSLSTSMLNSMGMENKTLLYYAIGAVLMLLCVWFLPAFIGVYALLIGFTFVYGISSVANLILIRKACVEKPAFIKFLSLSALLCLPAVLFGFIIEKLLISPLGIWLTTISVAVALVLFTGALFVAFSLVDIKQFKNKISRFMPKKRERVKQVKVK